jgi:hypothetical protein
VQVELVSGTLQSISEMELLAGGNAAAVEASPGRWEVLKFATAELVAARTYELSLFLRGQAGSDPEMAEEVAPGATFVLLDEAVRQLAVGSGEFGLALDFAAGPAQRDPADASYVAFSLTPVGTGLRPLRPVHLSARREGDDVIISWVRRSRLGADSWQGADVPLGEDVEAYVLDIFSGETVVRSVTSGSPSYRYTATERTADFGAPLPSTLHVQVAQVSLAFGPGAYAEAVLDV